MRLFSREKNEQFVNAKVFNISNSFSHILKNVYPFFRAPESYHKTINIKHKLRRRREGKNSQNVIDAPFPRE